MDIEKMLLAMEERINTKFNMIEKRLDEIDKRFDKIDLKFNEIDKRFDKIDLKLNEIDSRFDDLEGNNGRRHFELQTEINNINIVNAKNNLEISKLKKAK